MAKKGGKNKPKASPSRLPDISQARHSVLGWAANSGRVAGVD
jgi:hypothetical protein